MRYQMLNSDGDVLKVGKFQLEEVAVIHDVQTGLDWEVKSFNPKDARYSNRLMTWAEFTQNYIAQLNEIKYGGFDDWRAPSKHELRSLINYRSINPAFAQDVFQTLAPEDYWCGGSYGPRAEDCGWVINFNIGATTGKNKSLTSCGVAVRGKPLPQPDERFVDNGDGTITDTYSKLMWEKDVHPRTSYSQVLTMLPNHEFAGHKDWRLPTMHELSSIFDDSYSNNSWFFDKYFNGNEIPHYITYNTFKDTYVWVINFNFGYDGYYAEKNIGLGYRLVRSLNEVAEDFSIPSSGQTEIYDERGAVIKVDATRATVSFSEFDAYITDMKTGLSYEKATAKSYTFEEAVEHVKNLNAALYGGTNTWRLPTVDELRFIVDYSKKNPAVFENFAQYVKADLYWTAEKYITPNGDRNWAIYFGYGCAVPIEKVQRCGCIAVSGGYVNLSSKNAERYEIKDGCVIDKYTKLMWLQQELPAMTYSEFEKYLAENEFAGYRDWRIPDMKELSTIVNRSAENTEWFSRELFPNIFDNGRSFFIASETFNGMFNWGVNMIFAYDGYYANRLVGQYRIKPVRKI